MPIPLLITGAMSVLQSPAAKQIGGAIVSAVGGLFNRKKKTSSSSVRSSTVYSAEATYMPIETALTRAADSGRANSRMSGGGFTGSYSGGSASLASTQGGILDQVGTILDKVTKPSREFEVNTTVDKKTIGLIVVGLAGLIMLAKR